MFSLNPNNRKRSALRTHTVCRLQKYCKVNIITPQSSAYNLLNFSKNLEIYLFKIFENYTPPHLFITDHIQKSRHLI